MNKTAIKVILFLSIAGMSLSAWLTVQHLQINKKGFEEKSFCSINEYINCDAVNASSYSEILGVPVSTFAFLYFLLMLFYCIGALIHDVAERSPGLTFSIFPTILAVGFSLYMAYVSFAILELICLFCTALYIINIIILILTPVALRIKPASLPSFLFSTLTKRPKIFIHIPIALAVVLVGGLVFSNVSPDAEKSKNFDATKFLEFYFKQPQLPIEISGQPVWGNPDAKVIIVEFSDFQCPFCRLAAFNLKPFLTEYKKDIAIYFFNYPLDNSCNPNMQRPMHQQACNAAWGGICAKQNNKFWEFHDMAFANQKSLSAEKVKEYAKLLGIDDAAFTQGLASDETKNALLLDLEQAGKVDISGTPTIFINGRKFGPWRNVKALRTAISEEIKRSKEPLKADQVK